MIEEYCKKSYNKLLVDPVANILNKRVTANHITVLSGILGLLVLPALLIDWVYLAVILLLASGYCDTLDGNLARLNNHISNWGSVLDIMTDRLVEFIVVFALWSVDPESRGFLCLFMLGSMLLCITSFLVVGIFSTNASQKSFHYSPGIMERAEALLFFISMMLWPKAFSFLASVFIILVIFTAILRLIQFYRVEKNNA